MLLPGIKKKELSETADPTLTYAFAVLGNNVIMSHLRPLTHSPHSHTPQGSRPRLLSTLAYNLRHKAETMYRWQLGGGRSRKPASLTSLHSMRKSARWRRTNLNACSIQRALLSVVAVANPAHTA